MRLMMGLRRSRKHLVVVVVMVWLFCLLHLSSSPSLAFESDELLLLDEEEFEAGGGRSSSHPNPSSQAQEQPTTTTTTAARTPPTPRNGYRSSSSSSSDHHQDSDSKLHFSLQQAFGDSEFSAAGTFTARLKTSSHGGQTLTKLRFSRTDFSETEKEKFRNLLETDDFYKIRIPSNVLSPPGRDYIISSVKARCLPRDGLDEHFVIHMEGVNILAVNYGSPGACQYPRQLKYPAKWSFNSHTVLKNSEVAPRMPAFAEEILGGENGEDEGVKPLERSFWAKYWMYLIPLGLIVMNAVTQAMNMPEEQATGQSVSQTQQSVAATPRGQSSAVRRR